MDVTTPADIRQKVLEVLNIGAPLLLPNLKERIELLQEQLPKGNHLTRGQDMLLSTVLSSLEEPTHVAALLGFSNIPEKIETKDICLTEMLMTTLLQTLSRHTVSY